MEFQFRPLDTDKSCCESLDVMRQASGAEVGRWPSTVVSDLESMPVEFRPTPTGAG